MELSGVPYKPALAVAAGLSGLVLLRLLQYHHTPSRCCLPKKEAPEIWANPEEEEAQRKFDEMFSKMCAEQPANATYEESGRVVSSIISNSEFITTDDLLRSNAKKIFQFHRESAPFAEGGLGVRLTVQMNLFGGSVANLGNQAQRDWLKGVFERGELGCFILTETGAGVLSGLVVETTATWTDKGFVLHSPEPLERTRKYWISQGLIAKWGVVIARLILPGGVDKGPHAFIIDLETPGVHREDMPRKTDFNSLDNAVLWFDNVLLSSDSMLSGISSVDPQTGEYRLTNPKEPFSFVMVAQRLLSGRICIAGASLSFLRDWINHVDRYGYERPGIPVGRDQTLSLTKLPVMRDTLEELRAIRKVFRHYIVQLENDYMRVERINNELVNRIACAKIEAVQFAIDATHELKERVGSLTLLSHGPFGSKNDILYVFRFAEGDSAILQQKMVRDSLKSIASLPKLLLALGKLPITFLLNQGGVGLQRTQLQWGLIKLAFSMLGVSKDKMVAKWLESHELIETIAKLSARLTIYDSIYNKLWGTRELAFFRRRYFSS